MSALDPWWEVLAQVPEELADDAAALLIEAGALGVEIQSAELPLPRFGGEPPASRSDGATLVVSYAGTLSEALAVAQARDVLDDLTLESVSVVIRRRTDTDWSERWKTYFKPITVGRLWIVPSWEKAPLPADALRVELDPGLAFGTGQHATTALCLETMVSGLAERPSATLLDVGCGSGILAIAAVRLGVSNVVAVDNDPIAVQVTRENAERNRVQLQASDDDLARVPGRFDWVVANIMAGTLVELAPALIAHLVPGGALVLSGILAEQETLVHRAFTHDGRLRLEDRRERDNWLALRYRIA